MIRASLALLAASCTLACSEVDPQELHRRAIVIDGHSDTTPYFQDPEWRFDERHPRTETDMDIPRMREGGLDVQFWSIYMGKREGDGRSIREALERIDAVREMVRRHSDRVALTGSVAEIRRAVAGGKIASVMGVEGGHIIEDRLAMLRIYYALGVRYLTLTHSFHTNWADSSGTTEVPEPRHGGLTEFGEQVVAEMNRLGMLVDVSHVSDETFYDTLRVTKSPVIASHSSCRAVADHPRNMSDDMLRALAENGGVIMINFYPGYIDMEANAAGREHYASIADQLKAVREQHADDFVAGMRASREIYARHPFPQAPLSVLLDHFDHAIQVAGPDHVGLGADWDGVPSMPEGMDDVTYLPALTEGLLERGHSRQTVVKVLGENLLHVLAQNERTAREIASR
jgi:membrane dipeptidase